MANAGYNVAFTRTQFAYLVEAAARFQIEKLKFIGFNAFLRALLIEFPWNDPAMLENVIDDDHLFEKARHSGIRFAVRFDEQLSVSLREARMFYAEALGTRISISTTLLVLALSYLRSPGFAE